MTRIVFGVLLAAAIGCTGIRPAGPLAGRMGALPSSGKSKTDVEKDVPLEPVKVPSPKPTPPLNTVDPAEVTAGDPYAAAQKLMTELEGDSKTIPVPSKTAEVSVIPGRMR